MRIMVVLMVVLVAIWNEQTCQNVRRITARAERISAQDVKFAATWCKTYRLWSKTADEAISEWERICRE